MKEGGGMGCWSQRWAMGATYNRDDFSLDSFVERNEAKVED